MSKVNKDKRCRIIISMNMDDVIRASRRGSREAEQDVKGPGFHSVTRVHTSKKTYTRKDKQKHSPGTEIKN